MIRNFNYTDRKRILRDYVSFEWVDGNSSEPASFKATLNLNSIVGLRSDGKIWVEAYWGATVSRYYFGTVDQPIPPDDTRLKGFPRGLKPHFRIKVVDPEDIHMRLLAFADKIAPAEREEIESGRQSILPVEYVDTLGQQIWNVRMDESLQPVLQLNASITEPVGIATLARSAEFVALVYPAVIRQILSRLVLEAEDASISADHDWLKFGRALLSKSCPDRDSYIDNEEDFAKDAREWIDEVVAQFCHDRLAKDAYVGEKSENHHDERH